MAKTACKKCDPHELCEECPEWIFTLADLIMCMMGLFVILWVLKPGEKPQANQISQQEAEMIGAIRAAFGYEPDPNSNDPIDMAMLFARVRKAPMNGPGEKGVTNNDARGAEGTDPEVTSIRQGKQAVVGGRIAFEPGSAQLTRASLDQLVQIAKQIRGHRNVVMIKGHTSLDDFDESGTAEQKMDLSLRRAQAVADYLTGSGVSPDILRVQGCSTFEPIQQRAYTPDLKAMNRRVEVEATSTLADELQSRGTAPATPVGRATASVGKD